MSKFTEGTESSYAELPIPVNYLFWKRGNGQMKHLKDTDPGAYFGGWSAMVDGEEDKLPSLPIPIVTRESDDGKASYQRYASNVINFLPIASRMRYEKREKVFDNKKQRESEKVVAVSKEYVSGVHSGYQPMKQVFGLLYSDDGKTNFPAVLKLNKWSSFLSFSKAANKWKSVKISDVQVLIRRYGTVGVIEKGTTFPNFETFNDGKSTPIEAIGISTPMIIPVTPELDKLWEDAQAWAKCEKWNAQDSVIVEHVNQLPVMPEQSDEFPFGDPSQE